MPLRKPFKTNPKATGQELPSWRKRLLELAAEARKSTKRLLTIDEINEEVAKIRGR